jgi:hypothetical protein
MTLLIIINLLVSPPMMVDLATGRPATPVNPMMDIWARPMPSIEPELKLKITQKPMPSMEYCEKFVARVSHGKTGLYCISVGAGYMSAFPGYKSAF